MTKEYTQPAFPNPRWEGWGQPEAGMTLRDYFAAKAMQADMSTYTEDLIHESSDWFEARADRWYAVADAMMKVRNAK